MKNRVVAGLVLVCMFASGAAAQGTKHPYNFDDYASLPQAIADAVAPNGDVLYDVSHGMPTGRSAIEWHAMRADGSNDRILKFPAGFRPVGFTADGDIFGGYSVDDASQLAIFSFQDINEKSTPKTVISLPTGMGQVSISPDGSKFAIVTDPATATYDSEVKTVVQPDKSSVYVVGIDGKDGKWWSPELTQVQEVAWSPDSKSLAIISSTPKLGFHYIKSSIDVVNGRVTRHVASIGGSCGNLAWMGGGQSLAFLATNTSVLAPDHVWTVSATGGTPVDRTPKLKGSAAGMTSDAHGNIWVQVHRGVASELDRFDGGSLTPAITYPGGGVERPVFCSTANGPTSIVFQGWDPTHMPNVCVQDENSIKRLTHVGDSQIEGIHLGPVKVVNWKSKDGVALEGIATFPAGYVEGKKYPFIVVPHGGPESNDILHVDTNARFFAGLGYVVIQPQYRGSTGYGSDFMNAIYQHAGDRAYRDVDSATDYAIAQGWADPNRTAIMGWSSGGFLSAWAVTQTNRYKAAIAGAGITDWHSFIWTSDSQQIDYDARWPGKDPQAFYKFSAVYFADRVTTPILLLHGEEDRAVPTYQSQEFYEALLASGKTARMVTYPGAGHFPSRWQQRRDVYGEMAAWLQKYNP